MKVFLNPGHDRTYDSGAINPLSKLRECDVAYNIGLLVSKYLNDVGIETKLLQSDNLFYDSSYDLPCVVAEANEWEADLFISIHCNSFNTQARGTEVEVYKDSGDSLRLADCIQNQIVTSLKTFDRGIKERPDLIVLNSTNMTACLVETAFIDNENDVKLLINNQDDFAKAIARGVTDYAI
jgi:N-acetylmuramoyl-L-alanine amidase